MYKIEKKDWGYKLTFSDFIKAEEMQRWHDESKQILLSSPKEFGVFVDMINMKPLPSDAQEVLKEGQRLYKEKGMVRSVVIVNSTILKLQFQRIAKNTGIYDWERYIDASTVPNWEEVGIAWIKDGEDPDK